MNKKRIVSLVAACTMAFSLAACGSSSTGSKSSSKSGGITLLNGKPEIDKQLQELAKEYKSETGKKVTIQTVGGSNQATASDTLKKDYQAGTMPDIFVAETNQFANWKGKLADLSGEKWTKRTDVEYVDDSGATIGYPYQVEAHGMAYNADVLKAAGVDPASLTSPEAYKTAFETIDAKKSELGLTCVVDYGANATNLGWSTGTHLFGHYLDAGLKMDDTKYIDMLNDGGKIDKDRMTKFAEFVGLIQKYCDKTVAVDGTYDDETALFAQGKAAFVTQGSWFGANLTSNDDYKAKPFSVGIAPVAFEDGIDTILGGPSSYWAVYKSGNVKDAKAFLEWASEDKAQKILVEEAGLVSPYKDCKYTAKDPFAESVTSYMTKGKFSGWHTFIKKDGLQNDTSVVFQDYASGKIASADDFVSTLSQVIKSYYAN